MRALSEDEGLEMLSKVASLPLPATYGQQVRRGGGHQGTTNPEFSVSNQAPVITSKHICMCSESSGTATAFDVSCLNLKVAEQS